MAKKKDPTMELVERLKDESQWKIIRGVPALVPFNDVITLPDGTPRHVKIDEADLQETVINYIKRFQTTGMAGVLTQGHRKPGSDEKNLPPIVGHMMNARMGTWGPENKVGLLVDEFYYPKHWEKELWDEENKKLNYPFRSPEYYDKSKSLTGMAVLIRDPKLDMGMVTFARTPDGDCLYFAMEGMIDPTMPPTANPGDGTCPEGVPPEFYENFCKCMECYEGEEGGAGHYQRTDPVSTPAVTPVVPPVAAPTPAPADLVRDQQAIQFARMEKDISELRAELEAARKREQDTLLQFSKADCEKRCAQLEYEGYSLSEGWKEEVAILMSRDAAGREAFCNYLRTNRPTGQALVRHSERHGFLPVADSPVQFDNEDKLDFQDSQVALQLQKENPSMPWDKCMEKAREKRIKKTA